MDDEAAREERDGAVSEERRCGRVEPARGATDRGERRDLARWRVGGRARRRPEHEDHAARRRAAAHRAQRRAERVRPPPHGAPAARREAPLQRVSCRRQRRWGRAGDCGPADEQETYREGRSAVVRAVRLGGGIARGRRRRRARDEGGERICGRRRALADVAEKERGDDRPRGQRARGLWQLEERVGSAARQEPRRDLAPRRVGMQAVGAALDHGAVVLGSLGVEVERARSAAHDAACFGLRLPP